MSGGGSWRKGARWRVMESMLDTTGWTCAWCGRDLSADPKRDIHLDHLIPASKGGHDSIVNFVPSCPPCNRRKSDLSPGDFWKWQKRLSHIDTAAIKDFWFRRKQFFEAMGDVA